MAGKIRNMLDKARSFVGKIGEREAVRTVGNKISEKVVEMAGDQVTDAAIDKVTVLTTRFLALSLDDEASMKQTTSDAQATLRARSYTPEQIKEAFDAYRKWRAALVEEDDPELGWRAIWLGRTITTLKNGNQQTESFLSFLTAVNDDERNEELMVLLPTMPLEERAYQALFKNKGELVKKGYQEFMRLIAENAPELRSAAEQLWPTVRQLLINLSDADEEIEDWAREVRIKRLKKLGKL